MHCLYIYIYIYIYVCKLISKKIQNEAGVIEVCFNGVYMLTKIDSSQVSFFLCLCKMTNKFFFPYSIVCTEEYGGPASPNFAINV